MQVRQKRITLKIVQGKQFGTKQRIMLERNPVTRKKFMQEMRAQGRLHLTREKDRKKRHSSWQETMQKVAKNYARMYATKSSDKLN